MKQDSFDSECSTLIHFSRSLTQNKANLKDNYNQNTKEQVITQNIKKRRRALHEISSSRGMVWRRCFSNSIPYLWCLLFKKYINTPGQGQQDRNWTWLNLWNFSTINRQDKSSHNTIEWFGFILKCFSHYGQGKFSDLHCSNYWKMHLWNFSFPLAWSDH